MRRFDYALDKTLEEARKYHNENLYKLCLDVKDYVMQGTFSKKKHTDTVIKYWGETDKYVSEMTGIKEGTFRQARKNVSDILYGIFGYDFFEVIRVGDKKAVAEGRYRLSLASRKLDAAYFVFRDLESAIRRQSEKVEGIDITTCGLEIQFLIKHSKQSVFNEMSKLDINKLGYLLRMLDNEVGSSANRNNLIKVLDRNKERGDKDE